jgi:hypothetical protein
MQSYVKRFEIWQSRGECVATSVCPAGPAGDACRARHEAGSQLVHVFEAWSEFDYMQKYYDFMDFGVYKSPWPDLAARPFHFIDALANLETLKKPLQPLQSIAVMADSSTNPAIPDPMPRIVVQDRAVFTVDVWIRGDFGGHGEVPTNEPALMQLADALLRNEAPVFLKNVQSTFLICPLAIAEQMQWPADGRDPAEQRTSEG